MLKMTEIAEEKFREFFGDKEPQPIRVFLGEGGCAGPQLMMALDEKKLGDTEFKFGDITIVTEQELLEFTGGITVDANEYGFQVISENPVGGGGCDCNSGCGCGC